jgi:thiol:disulfide interchange protein DsbG
VTSKFLAVACALLLAMCADAQTPAADTAPGASIKPPPALRYPLQRGFHIERRFSAVSGLTGWVLKDPDGQYRVLYSTADGQTLISGDLYSGNGAALSEQYAAQYLPQPDLSTLWSQLEKAQTITTGASGTIKSTIYVIMDPNCIYCHLLWKALKPYESAGLQVKWLPVGFLHEDSEDKAAALLKGGAAAFEQSQETFNEASESGGISGIKPTPELQGQLDANLQLMKDANIQGTPGVFYKDRAGKVVRKAGMPLMNELAEITGLPAQPESDPELKPFLN